MSANEYISLARNYSFVLLLVSYLALDGTASFLRRIHLLDEARRSFAEALVFRPNGVFDLRKNGARRRDRSDPPVTPDMEVLILIEPGIGRVAVREQRQWTLSPLDGPPEPRSPGFSGAAAAAGAAGRDECALGPAAKPADEVLAFTLRVRREDGRQWEVSVANAKADRQSRSPASGPGTAGGNLLFDLAQIAWRRREKPGCAGRHRIRAGGPVRARARTGCEVQQPQRALDLSCCSAWACWSRSATRSGAACSIPTSPSGNRGSSSMASAASNGCSRACGPSSSAARRGW